MFTITSVVKGNLNMNVQAVTSNRPRVKVGRQSPTAAGDDSPQDRCDKVSQRKTRRMSSGRTCNQGRVSRSTSPNGKSITRCFVNHSYHDHIQDTADETMSHVEEELSKKESHRGRGGPRGGVSTPFPEKLHEMLSKAVSEAFDHIVSWHPHGRSFAVHQPKRFVIEVMPLFFKQSKLTSFQRQLNLYGFSRLTTGPDRGGYYHELFLRSRVYLSKRMIRTRVKGTGVKAAASPATEPNFYDMQPCLDESGLENLEAVIQTLPTKKLSEVSSGDSSMNLWMLPTLIPDESSDSEDDVDSPPASPRQVMPDCAPSAPWSPQAVVSELEASLSEVGQLTSRCSSPLGSFLENSFDETVNVLLCHSGDEIMFEGQRFHYLDTDFFINEDLSSRLQSSSSEVLEKEISCADESLPSFVDWQVNDTFGEFSVSV